VSKPYKNESYSKQPDYIKEISMDTHSYAKQDHTEVQTQEDIDEGWTENQSPMTGRIAGTMADLEDIQSSEMMNSDEVREGIQDSIDCYQTCTETTLRCLTMGGKHAESKHINLLMDCAKICNINADFMLRNSTYYPQTCGICADICDECGDDCDKFEEDFMKECASTCRRCAEACREMTR